MKWLALVLAAGCAGRVGEIINDPGDLSEGGGSPGIDAVAELGGGDVVLTAPLVPAVGDGFATVGEALWVRGSSFGRRPTVTIGGRPAAILARTSDGGLVVRVPPAVPEGRQPLTVANDNGRDDFQLSVRRFVAALPAGGGRLVLAELSSDGPRATGELPVSGRFLRVGADGRAAYVADATTGLLTVFELPAQGGPRQVSQLDLNAGRGRGGDPVTGLLAAMGAPVLAVLAAREVMVLDTTTPLRPVRSQWRPLPDVVRKGGVAAIALSPDGQVAAAALAQGNRVVLFDLKKGGEVPVLAEIAIAPEARVPVLVDVAFTPDGRTLWVVAGDTAASRQVGPQNTELIAVRIDALSPPALRIARRVRIEEASAPVGLNTGRAIPLASGASIRLPPERATVYLTASNHAGVATVYRLGPEDHAAPFAEIGGSAGAADLTPDGRWLLVPTLLPAGRGLDGGRAASGDRLAVIAAPADDHPGVRRTVDLGTARSAVPPQMSFARAGAAVPKSPPAPSLATQP